MGKLFLNDGRTLELDAEQQDRLAMVILLTADMGKRVKVGDESFSLNDIVTDPNEIQRIAQTKMFDIKPVIKRKDSRGLA